MTKKWLPSEIPFDKTKELAGKAGHISDEYIQKAGKDFSRLKIDSLGNIKVIPSELKNKKKEFFEPNHHLFFLYLCPFPTFVETFLLETSTYGVLYPFYPTASLLE